MVGFAAGGSAWLLSQVVVSGPVALIYLRSFSCCAGVPVITLLFSFFAISGAWERLSGALAGIWNPDIVY